MASNDGIAEQQNLNHHFLVWLDDHIGHPHYCRELKREFFTTTDPCGGIRDSLSPIDIDNLLQNTDIVPVNFEGVTIQLRAFTDVGSCLEFILENTHKRIYLIVSGKLGRIIVPCLMTYCPEVFQNVKGQPCGSIYCFCLHMRYQGWTRHFRGYIQKFNTEPPLLACLCRDIGDALMASGDAKSIPKTLPTAREALQYYGWAKKLFHRASNLQNRGSRTKILEANKRINQAEALVKLLTTDDDDAHHVTAAAEN